MSWSFYVCWNCIWISYKLCSRAFWRLKKKSLATKFLIMSKFFYSLNCINPIFIWFSVGSLLLPFFVQWRKNLLKAFFIMFHLISIPFFYRSFHFIVNKKIHLSMCADSWSVKSTTESTSIIEFFVHDVMLELRKWNSIVNIFRRAIKSSISMSGKKRFQTNFHFCFRGFKLRIVFDCSAINITEKQAKSRQKTVYQHFPSALVSGYRKMRKICCRYLLPYQHSIPFDWRYCIPTKTSPEFYQIFHFHFVRVLWTGGFKTRTCILFKFESVWNFFNTNHGVSKAMSWKLFLIKVPGQQHTFNSCRNCVVLWSIVISLMWSVKDTIVYLLLCVYQKLLKAFWAFHWLETH